MLITRLQVNVSQLSIGMFVSNLDCPWGKTPFPLQGFLIQSPGQIEELKRYCNAVHIDVAKSEVPIEAKKGKAPLGSKGGVSDHTGKQAKPITVKLNKIKIQSHSYAPAKPIKTEFKQAKRFHDDVKQSLESVSKQIMGGEIPTIDKLKSSVGNMVESVIRSPDTFTWLCQVNDKDNYTYSHSLRCAVWAVIFGRHIGLSKSQLDILAASVLLKDIGKIKLPKGLLEKKNKTPQEQKIYETFVVHSTDMLKLSKTVDTRVIKIVETHCEYVNGSGFPHQLEGDKIPLLAKIAGLVTFYDNLVNPRVASMALSSSKATAELYKQRNYAFQEQLIVEFIHAIGLYPVGTAVVLSTGEVGLVVEQNSQHRLKPKVLILIDKYKSYLGVPVVLDMAQVSQKNNADKVEISRDIELSRLGISTEQARDLLLQSSHYKSLFSRFNIFR